MIVSILKVQRRIFNYFKSKTLKIYPVIIYHNLQHYTFLIRSAYKQINWLVLEIILWFSSSIPRKYWVWNEFVVSRLSTVTTWFQQQTHTKIVSDSYIDIQDPFFPCNTNVRRYRCYRFREGLTSTYKLQKNWEYIPSSFIITCTIL